MYGAGNYIVLNAISVSCSRLKNLLLLLLLLFEEVGRPRARPGGAATQWPPTAWAQAARHSDGRVVIHYVHHFDLTLTRLLKLRLSLGGSKLSLLCQLPTKPGLRKQH